MYLRTVLGSVRELLLRNGWVWADGVVPFAVEVMPPEIDRFEFSVGDLDAGGIGYWVEFAAHFQAGLGRGGGDQLHDDLVADERLAAPVDGDEREEAVLN